MIPSIRNEPAIRLQNWATTATASAAVTLDLDEEHEVNELLVLNPDDDNGAPSIVPSAVITPPLDASLRLPGHF